MRTKTAFALVMAAMAIAGAVVINLGADEISADADGLVTGYGSSGTGDDAIAVYYWTDEVDGDVNTILYIEPKRFVSSMLSLYIDGRMVGHFQLPYARAVAFDSALTPGDHTFYLTNGSTYVYTCTLKVGVTPVASHGSISVDRSADEAIEWSLGNVIVCPDEPVWESSDDTKAVVSDGTVTGVSAGPATVTVKFNVWTHTYNSATKKMTIGSQPMVLGQWDVKCIEDADVTAAPSAKDGLKYTGEDLQLLNDGSADNGTVWYSLDITDDNAWSTTVPTGDVAKVYTVYWKVVGASEYYRGTEAESISVTIGKADYDMNGVTFPAMEKVYNGDDQSLEISGTLPTGADGISVTVSYSGNGRDVGEHTITANFATASTNYNAPSPLTAKLTITAKPLPSISSIAEVTYNTQAQAPTVEIMDGSVKLIEGTDYTLSWDKDGFTDAGTYNATATGKGNYSGEQTVAYVIEPIAVTVQKVDESKAFTKTYDGNTDVIVPMTMADFRVLYGTEEVSAHQVSIQSQSYDSEKASDNSGATKVTVTFILSGDSGNYVFADGSSLDFGAAIIPKALPTVSDIGSVVYNAENQIPVITVTDHARNIDLAEDADYTIAWTKDSASVTEAIDAGIYTVTATGTGNYSGSWSKTFEITKAPIEFDVRIAGWAEEHFAAGTNMPYVVVKGGTDAFVHSEGAAASFTYNDGPLTAEILGALGPGSYSVKASFPETDNYQAGESTATFSVSSIVVPVVNGDFATIESATGSIAVTNSIVGTLNGHTMTIKLNVVSGETSMGVAVLTFPSGTVFQAGDRFTVEHLADKLGYTYDIDLPDRLNDGSLTIDVKLPVPKHLVSPKVSWNNGGTWEEIESTYDYVNGYMVFSTTHNSEYQVLSKGQIGITGMSFADDFTKVHFFLKPLEIEPEKDVSEVELVYSYYLENSALKLDGTKTLTDPILDEHGNLELEDKVVVMKAKMTLAIRGSYYKTDWIECVAQDERTLS